ncbi:MAG: MFS transporter [Candidatus Odinarchaeota archaeon]
MLNWNITTLIFTHFLWGFVNATYLVVIQPHIVNSLELENLVSGQYLGIIMTIANLSMVMPLLLGFLADNYGSKRMLIIGKLFSLLGLFGLLSSIDILVVTGSLVIFNCGIGLYNSPLQAMIYQSSTKKNRAMAYSLIYNSASIAGIVTTVVMQIDGFFTIQAFFVFTTVLLLFAIIANSFLLKNPVLPSVKTSASLFKVMKEPRFKLTTFAFFLDSFVWGLSISIAYGLFVVMFGFDFRVIAMLELCKSLFLVLFQYPAGFIVDKIGKFGGLLIGEFTAMPWLLSVVLAIFNPVISRELLIIGFCFLGISIAFWRPSVTISFTEMDPRLPATYFGYMSFFQTLGWVPTALIGGILFDWVGYLPILVTTFIGTIIVVFLFRWINRLEKEFSMTIEEKGIMIPETSPIIHQ